MQPRVLLVLALITPPFAEAQIGDPAMLDGAWVRVGSNYDLNDQMRISIAGGLATLTRVPSTGHASFRVGQRLWTDIAGSGSLQVRGSNGRYYPARLSLLGTGTLRLAIDESAMGNDQLWRRAGPTVDGEWVRIAPGDPAADGTRLLAANDQATVRYLPGGAPRSLRIGSRIWRGIGAGGAVEILGDAGQYQSGTIRIGGVDTLWVDGKGITQAQLWVRPKLVHTARAAAASSPAGAACASTGLRHHATGLTWSWNIAVPDDEHRAAELLGVLDYDGTAPGRGVVTDFEMTTLPGLAVEASVIWQHTERRSPATNYATGVNRNLDAAAFDAANHHWREQGYRATDIEVYDTPAGVRFAGVWMTNLEGAEWSVHHGLTSAAFGDLFEERRAAGFRLVDIEIYQTAGGQRHAAIWLRSCDNTNWREFRGMSRVSYQRRVDSLSTLGFRVVDFESYRTSAGQRYAAIWEQVPRVAWGVRSDRTLRQFLNHHREYTDRGYRLVDYESYETATGTRYAGVWAENDARYRMAGREALDSTMDAYRAAQRIPGLSVAIIRNGEVIYRRGAGWADSARGKEAYSGTIYPAASVSKVIAGTLAARLEERGVIDLTRPTRAFVDSLPANHTHTLEQLLAKTGCVGHYNEVAEPPEQFYQWRADALRAVQSSLRSWMLPNCTPGADWHYSTHGYTLLGAALEAVTGKTIVTLVKDEIAQPMGLRTLNPLIPLDGGDQPVGFYRLSQPYTMDTSTAGVFPSVLSRHEDATWKLLGGGFQIDAPDLARFGWLTLAGGAVSDSTRDNRLWRRLTTAQMLQWSDTTRAIPTALGWEIRAPTLAGSTRRLAEHSGTAVSGARTHLLVLRDEGISVAVLSNQREGPGTIRHAVRSLARSLAAIVLNPPAPPP